MYLLFFIVFTRGAVGFSDCRNSNRKTQVSQSKIPSEAALNHDVDQYCVWSVGAAGRVAGLLLLLPESEFPYHASNVD
jgi:hypothetical protein